jgi:hypothetical protein
MGYASERRPAPVRKGRGVARELHRHIYMCRESDLESQPCALTTYYGEREKRGNNKSQKPSNSSVTLNRELDRTANNSLSDMVPFPDKGVYILSALLLLSISMFFFSQIVPSDEI